MMTGLIVGAGLATYIWITVFTYWYLQVNDEYYPKKWYHWTLVSLFWPIWWPWYFSVKPLFK